MARYRGWAVSVDAIIWAMTAYVFVYYAVARHALSILKNLDKDYFDMQSPDGGLPAGMKTSSAIVEMIFDFDLPHAEYGSVFKYELYAARMMLIMFLPVFFLLFWLA